MNADKKLIHHLLCGSERDIHKFSTKDLSLKAQDRSQYKLHISIKSDCYNEEVIKDIMKILENDLHIHTFKHVDIERITEDQKVANSFKRAKSPQEQEFEASVARLLKGDQFTIHLPYFIDLKDTMELVTQLEATLKNIDSGDTLVNETRISDHINLRREYTDNEVYIPARYNPSTPEEEKALAEFIKPQDNHILKRYYEYKLGEPNKFDSIIERLVDYIHDRIPQPEYKKSFLSFTFGASKTEKLNVVYNLVNTLITNKGIINFSDYEVKLLDNSELSPIYHDLLKILKMCLVTIRIPY